jgi:NAD(P)-dependent dehydrogenase (short-subunit alcohol dehydrogenase family)
MDAVKLRGQRRIDGGGKNRLALDRLNPDQQAISSATLSSRRLQMMSDYTSRFNLQGKRVLVTGASRGIGAEIATLLADAGADVGIVGRDAEGLGARRQAIASKGRRCVAIQAHLQTVEGPRIAGAQALEFFGTVDILVNNAGVFHRQSILETTVEQWDETQAVNLRAPFLLSKDCDTVI